MLITTDLCENAYNAHDMQKHTYKTSEIEYLLRCIVDKTNFYLD